jgi:hypothetical protein
MTGLVPRPGDVVVQGVAARVARDEHVAMDTAAVWVEELLRFLALGAQLARVGSTYDLVPSPPVDAAWHAFILHTRAYTEFCERNFGEYAHHDPAPPADADGGGRDPRGAANYLLTRMLMQRHFGPLDDHLWPTGQQDGPMPALATTGRST